MLCAQMQAALIEMNAEKEAALKKEREAKRDAEEKKNNETGTFKVKDSTIKMIDLEGKTRTGKVPAVTQFAGLGLVIIGPLASALQRCARTFLSPMPYLRRLLM